MKSHDEIWSEWQDLVNMTPAELRKWLDTDESQAVGDTHGDGERTGHKSGRRIIEIKDRKKSELTDDDWSRGKCGFKAIQCMACGVPVVAAAVGVNREIITDGVDSFLASTPQEWIDKLGRLLSDPELRTRMAAAGRRTIEERYSLKVTAPRLARILQEAVAVNR